MSGGEQPVRLGFRLEKGIKKVIEKTQSRQEFASIVEPGMVGRRLAVSFAGGRAMVDNLFVGGW